MREGRRAAMDEGERAGSRKRAGEAVEIPQRVGPWDRPGTILFYGGRFSNFPSLSLGARGAFLGRSPDKQHFDEQVDEGSTRMNTDRLRALAKLAEHYGIDPQSEWGGSSVAYFLERPFTIPAYFEVVHDPGDIGWGDEVIVPAFLELRATSDPRISVERQETHYDPPWTADSMIAVVDLDAWKVLQRDGQSSDWTWSDLPG